MAKTFPLLEDNLIVGDYLREGPFGGLSFLLAPRPALDAQLIGRVRGKTIELELARVVPSRIDCAPVSSF